MSDIIIIEMPAWVVWIILGIATISLTATILDYYVQRMKKKLEDFSND